MLLTLVYLAVAYSLEMEALDQTAIVAHLKQLYAKYRHTAELEAKAKFFSPECRQICRPTPAFAATNRETIMRYLRETSGKGTEKIQEFVQDQEKTTTVNTPVKETMVDVNSQKRSYYTIRPLTPGEMEFGSNEAAVPAGFGSATDVKIRAEGEGWVGMRVDLWDDEENDLKGKAQGILVKVQYWWREESGVWLQILHDIMYLGSRDGTEGSEGEILE